MRAGFTVFAPPHGYAKAMSSAQAYTSEELQAMWQTFQQSQEASCPVCGGVVRIELVGDPAEGGGEVAEISAKCSNCGREGRDKPGEHTDTQGWLD